MLCILTTALLHILEQIKAFSNLRTCQKDSHRVCTLQNAYLARPPTTPLKNAMRAH